MLALDTDVLVHWTNLDAEHHEAVQGLIRREVEEGGRLALAQQVCWEFLHIITDPRRLERPLTMEEAIARIRAWWDAPETVRITLPGTVVHRALELMGNYGLGRKRILDTALAATLEAAAVRRIATLNGGDFEVFPFIDVVDPR